ncbi:CRISPR-associated endonuclease Cas3'' [Myxococcus xanthus]|nr:CRISPR-associated endonuclease Cas3'' [Myxococcus xanthus]
MREHLEAVGQWAARLAPREDLRAPALATGRWHDLGKYTRDFQIRIRKENGFEAHLEKEGALERDHSTAGALWALSRDRRLLPLALAIAGHHAGLPDLPKFKERVGRDEKQALLADARARCDSPSLLDESLGFSPETLVKRIGGIEALLRVRAGAEGPRRAADGASRAMLPAGGQTD